MGKLTEMMMEDCIVPEQTGTVTSEPTAAQEARAMADYEDQFTETDGDRDLRIAQAHAQFLANVTRGLLGRLYGAKVAAGELPAANLMSMIEGELGVINKTLNTLTENGGGA